MRRFGCLLFSTLSLGALLYALLSVIKLMASSTSDGTPAKGFGLLLMTTPLAVLVCVPVVFVLLCVAFRPPRR